MSIPSPKISEEEHSSVLNREPSGYIENAVKWFSHKVLHLNFLTLESLEKQKLIELINQQMLCPIVLFKQFNRFVVRSQRVEIFVTLGKGIPLSYKDRVWNWLFRDASQIKQRYCEIGKSRVMKDPYLLVPALIRELSRM